jgi:hypothetical protein
MMIGDKSRINSFLDLLFNEIIEEFEIEEGKSKIINLVKWKEVFEITKTETSKIIY